MKQLQFNIRRRESGATAVEYALIVGLMAVAIITALSTFSGDLSEMFTAIGTKLDAVATAGTDPD